jgi:uncharacterized protein (DUF1697 family)
MDHLAGLFRAMGFNNVETFIASGNVFFDSRSTKTASLEKQIEHQLQLNLGYPVATFLRTPSDLAAVANYKPFSEKELKREIHAIYIGFLRREPDTEAVNKVLTLTSATDALHIRGRELYWLARKDLRESSFSGALLEKTLQMEATLRNITTVSRIVAKFPDT